jgi:replicative DNA helicase
MSLLMARPGVGKSLFAGQVALSAAQWLKEGEGAQRLPGHVVKIVLCEMTKEAFQDRMACALAGVNQRRVRSGFLTAEQLQSYHLALDVVADLPLEYLDDTSSLTETTNFIRRGNKPAWWLLDYIGNHPSGNERIDNEDYRRVSYVSSGLRELTKHFCPGLVVVQMNRSVESSMRKDKRPMLSDLRDSGKLEQDASGVVMGLYRPDIYAEIPAEERSRPKQAELVVLKQRNGPVGTVELMWLPQKPGWADVSEVVDELEAEGAA